MNNENEEKIARNGSEGKVTNSVFDETSVNNWFEKIKPRKASKAVPIKCNNIVVTERNFDPAQFVCVLDTRSEVR